MGFNFASKLKAIRIARDLQLTTAHGKRFAVAPTDNDYGDTFLGIYDDSLGRYRCIAGVAPNGRFDPLGELLIDGKPSIAPEAWQPCPTDPFA